MPIDPSIALNVLPPQQQNPTAILQSAAQFGALQQDRQALAQERQQQIQAAQQKQAEQAAINHALQSTVTPDGQVDVDAAANLLTTSGHGTAAETLRENHAKFVDQEIKNRGAAADALNKELDNLQRLAGGVQDQNTLNAYRMTVAQTAGPQYASALPTAYDPKTWAPVLGWFDTAKDSIDRQKAALDAVKEAREASNPETWTKAIGSLSFLPADRFSAALGELKQAMPANMKYLTDAVQTPQDAANLNITPEQRAQREQTAANEAAQQSRFSLSFGLEKQKFGLEQQKFNQSNAPVDDLKPYTSTTASGTNYINLDKVQGTADKKRVSDAARAAGIPTVDSKTDAGLQASDSVRSTLSTIMSQIENKLPKDGAGRITAGPSNKLSQYFQTDSDLAAFNSWRTAAIQTVQALAQPGMGLRINQAEINAAMNNDIPQVTDTVETARKRIANLITMLDNKEKATLTSNRSVTGGGKDPLGIR